MMQNAFYFILKALFVLKICKSRKNGLIILNALLISKFAMSEPG